MKARGKLKSIIKIAAADFFKEIADLLEEVWTTESLGLMGECFGHERLAWLRFLPKDYVAPDETSVSLLLTLATPMPADWGFPRNVEDNLANKILLRSSLSHAAWGEFIEKLHLDDTEMPKHLIEALSRIDSGLFESILQTLLHEKKAGCRVAALRILAQSPDSPHRETCARLGAHLDMAAKSKSEEEAKLLRHVTALYESLNQADQPQTHISKYFPDLKVSPAWSPSAKQPIRFTPACAAFLLSLDQFIADNSAEILQAAARSAHGKRFTSLAEVRLNEHNPKPWELDLERLWQKWFGARATSTRDADGLELVRVATYSSNVLHDDRVVQVYESKGINLAKLCSLETPSYYSLFPESAPAWARKQPLVHPVYGDVSALRQIKHPNLVWPAVKHLVSKHASWADFSYKLDMAEAICAALPKEATDPAPAAFDTRPHNIFEQDVPVPTAWLQMPKCLVNQTMPVEVARRLFHLQRWMKFPRTNSLGVDHFAIHAFGRGAATLGDVAERLLGEPANPPFYGQWLTYATFAQFRSRYRSRLSEWTQFTNRLAALLISSEASRQAKAITELTPLACSVGYLEGYQFFEQMLVATAKLGIIHPTDSETNYRNVLSRLTAAFHPSPEDDLQAAAERLRGLIKKRQITQQHLLRAGFLAPQWLETVSQALDWPGLREIQAWYYFHLSCYSRCGDPTLAAWIGTDNQEFRQEAEITGADVDIHDWYRRRLTAQVTQTVSFRPPTVEILDTEQWVDDQWFQTACGSLDDKKWKAIVDAAGVMSTPKHVAAVLALADAMRGKANRKSLLAGVKATKKAIDIRAIALLPMDKGAQRGVDILERYRAVETYRTAAKKFYEDEKESAFEMVDRTLAMLAARAELSSVEQLEWLVQSTAADEFNKHARLVDKDVEVRLTIDHAGTPICTITKSGKQLKAFPSALKSDTKFQQQQSVLKSLQKFATESRKTAVQAMIDGQRFKLDDLAQMMQHPILNRILQSTLFTDEANVGLLTEQCINLTLIDGKVSKLSKSAELRIAHPTDLIGRGGWVRWRDKLGELGLSQAFTQLERGCFLPNQFLRAGEPCKPLLGQQIEENQAVAILHTYGWEGHSLSSMNREFPAYGVTAEATGGWESMFSEVLRVESVTFRVADAVAPFEAVPVIPFSETMRELFLTALAAQLPRMSEELQRRQIKRLLMGEA